MTDFATSESRGPGSSIIRTGGPNEKHSPAVEEGTRTHTEAAPADRRGTRGAGQQFERITHDVRSRSAAYQPGAENAMGEAEGKTDENDLGGRTQADRGGAASTVG